MADVTMPQLGETVTEGTITKWFKQVGDAVAEDEVLFEVSTDKVDSEVPSPVSEAAPATEIAPPAAPPQPAPPPAAATPPPPPAVAPPTPQPAAPPRPPAAPPPQPATTTRPAGPAPATAGDSGKVLSPVVRRLLAEHGLDPSQIRGTGAGGRITRNDVLAVIEARRAGSPPPAAPAPVTSPVTRGERGADTVVPFSNIRRRTAEHMVRSKQTSAHAMASIEVDYEAVEAVRRAERERWKAEEGFSLTYLPFIARAVVDAIREFPEVNASIGDNELIVHNYVNLGIAVDLDFKGLMVPVIHDAETKRMRAIAEEISDLAARARSKRLSPDEIVGGTFTITNPGPFGTLLTLPIINQPQVAILSTDGVKRRPVVVELPDGGEAIAIHSVGNLALTWDHRAFDGAYAAAFIRDVKNRLETHDWFAEL